MIFYPYIPSRERFYDRTFLISPVEVRGRRADANCDRKVIMRTVKLTIFPGSERRGRRGSLIEPFMHSPFMYVHEFVKGNGRKGGERGSNTRKMLNHATFCSLSDRAMKTVVSVAYPPLDGRRRASMLICFAFIIALPILASAHDQKNGHGSAYASKSDDKMEFSKNSKDSKISLLDDENDDSGVRLSFFVV